MQPYFSQVSSGMLALMLEPGSPDYFIHIPTFLANFDDDAQLELRGDIGDRPVRLALSHIFPRERTLRRIAEASGIPYPIVVQLTVELWRLSEELYSPSTAGSRSVPEAVVLGLLGLRNSDAPPITAISIVMGAIVSFHQRQISTYHISNNREHLAAKAYILSKGGHFYSSFEDYVETARREQWPGFESLLVPYRLQVEWLKRKLPEGVQALASQPFHLMGLFDNVSGNFGRRSLWVLQGDIRDAVLVGADVWSWYPLMEDRTLGERDALQSPSGQWLVQWRLPKMGQVLYEMIEKSTGNSWTIASDCLRVIRHGELEQELAGIALEQ